MDFAAFVIGSVTPDTHVCQDKIDNCSQYGLTVCTTYQPWARDHCSAYCGFCIAEQLANADSKTTTLRE
uniref:ShKT domain-containing protein n=1 Tax=Magallana gigas TaxID=29159 RepID=K1PHA2_MAGGI